MLLPESHTKCASSYANCAAPGDGGDAYVAADNGDTGGNLEHSSSRCAVGIMADNVPK